MQGVQWAGYWLWISRIADVLSIVIVALQIAIFWYARKIQRAVYAIGRVPELTDTLGKLRADLAAHLVSFEENTHLIRETLVKARPIVENLRRKTSPGLNVQARQLVRKIDEYLGAGSLLKFRYQVAKHGSERQCRDIYEGMIGLESSLTEEYADRRWRIG
jgi:hypothetical protein